MTGIQNYSLTASENVQSNTGIDWDEGMAPGQVNNSARQNMADLRAAFDDLVWFQYGAGSKAPAPVYAGGTSFTQAAASSLSAVYHVGRRIKAQGSSTGTIYGAISSTGYATGTQTVGVTWDSGALSNEALTIWLSQIPVTGSPVAGSAVTGINNGSWSGTQLAVANGGTGATTASGARTNLGVPANDGTGASGSWGINASTATTATTANGLNASNSYTAVDFTISSDDRLKDRNGKILDALDKIEQLTGFYYRYNEKAQELRFTNTGLQVGVSAQEVQKVLPEAVRPWGNHPEYLTVAYDRLMPLVLEGIKALRAEVRAMKEAP